MNFRSIVFNLLDYLRGGLIKSRIRKIESAFHNELKASDNLKERINILTKHCSQSVPFYKNKDLSTWEDIPIVDKNIIRKDYKSFVLDNQDLTKLSYVTTSGSTGTPFKSYRGPLKKAQHIADNILFNQLAGLNLGIRLYYFRVWNKLVNKSKIKQWVQNIMPLDAGDFSDRYITTWLKNLSSYKGNSATLAYASTYEGICKTLHNLDYKKYDFSNINSFISMSEALPLPVKQHLENTFNANVISRYSNMENGFIAQQMNWSNEAYVINRGSYFVEVLSEEGKEITNGQIGRIVITDLYNLTMPFLRYDTGDMGIRGKICYNGRSYDVLESVEGRKVDFLYNTSGDLISPHTVTNTMWLYDSIIQFQFIQKGSKSYLLKLNLGKPKPNITEIITRLKEVLGEDAEIDSVEVEEVPLLSSGKRRKVVQEFYK